MPVGLPVALFVFAQAASAAGPAEPVYGPEPTAPAKPAASPEKRECVAQPNPKGNEIVVCALKPEGYRLPPDIVEARKLKKQGIAGRPHNPHETYANHSCANVGPMGCRGTPTVDLIAVAAVAAQISERMAKGQPVGPVFETTPAKGDYQYYVEAKKEREAKEAKAAADAAKAKAQADERKKRPDADLTASAHAGN